MAEQGLNNRLYILSVVMKSIKIYNVVSLLFLTCLCFFSKFNNCPIRAFIMSVSYRMVRVKHDFLILVESLSCLMSYFRMHWPLHVKLLIEIKSEEYVCWNEFRQCDCHTVLLLLFLLEMDRRILKFNLLLSVDVYIDYLLYSSVFKYTGWAKKTCLKFVCV